MSDIAIRAESLGKEFHIGHVQARYKTIREVATDLLLDPFRKMRGLVRGQSSVASDLHDTIWALRDVDFEIRRGEVIGIIGHNGAGKSTLLKILSRITEPTKGFVEVTGRVGSLLEVGTGFHPELTGRENTYLNGAILGMRKTEIDRKFDEIVAFAEVEKFLDTPVKHYSSGMQTRLGFAVAAYLDPEILLVDEVLAVGDVAFQKKCLGKMHDVAKGGRTVVFVSHNMGRVAQLCERAFWLEQGQILSSGEPTKVISAYISNSSTSQSSWVNPVHDPGRYESEITGARILTTDGEPTPIVHYDQDFKIEIAYDVHWPEMHNVVVITEITDSLGNVVLASWDTDSTDWNGRIREPGHYLSTCHVPANLLRPGQYMLTFTTGGARGSVDVHEGVLSLEVSEVGYIYHPGRVGVIAPTFQWEVMQVREEKRGALT